MEIVMYLILAILFLTALCFMAAPVVLGILFRVIIFVVCLIGSLLLREFVAKGITFLFHAEPIVAEVAAVILLYLALWSILRRCLQKAASVATLNSWKAIGIDFVSVAMPGSLILAGLGGIFLPGTVAWYGAGLFIVFVVAIGMAGLDMIFPRAFWMVSRKLWRICGDVQTGKGALK